MSSDSSASASTNSRSNGVEAEQRSELIKKMKSHQVALAELNSLSPSRTVYQKNGNIYFLTTYQKATASEQKLLDQAKSQLEKLNSV